MTPTTRTHQMVHRVGREAIRTARTNPMEDRVVLEPMAIPLAMAEMAALARTVMETENPATVAQAELAATTPTTVPAGMQETVETEATASMSSPAATEERVEMEGTVVPTAGTLVTAETEGMADRVDLESAQDPALLVDQVGTVEMPAIHHVVMQGTAVMEDPEEPEEPEEAVKAGQADRAALVVTPVQAVTPPMVTEAMVVLVAMVELEARTAHPAVTEAAEAMAPPLNR